MYTEGQFYCLRFIYLCLVATQSTVPSKRETRLGTRGIIGVGSEGVNYYYPGYCNFSTLLPYYCFFFYLGLSDY